MDKKNKIIIISLLSALLIALCVLVVEMKSTEKKAYQGLTEIEEEIWKLKMMITVNILICLWKKI